MIILLSTSQGTIIRKIHMKRAEMEPSVAIITVIAIAQLHRSSLLFLTALAACGTEIGRKIGRTERDQSQIVINFPFFEFSIHCRFRYQIIKEGKN